LAVAPAMFDRAEKDADLGYGEKDYAKGREMRGKLNDEMIVADVQAAIDHARSAGKVGLTGYCFGGYVAFLSAVNASGLACASSYHGGGVAAKKDLKPKCPMEFHFGDKDHAIPLADCGAIKAAQPDAAVYVYDDSGHG